LEFHETKPLANIQLLESQVSNPAIVATISVDLCVGQASSVKAGVRSSIAMNLVSPLYLCI
jgi:hypothetical protein